MILTIIILMIVLVLGFIIALMCITSEAEEEIRLIVKDIEDYIEFQKGKRQ